VYKVYLLDLCKGTLFNFDVIIYPSTLEFDINCTFLLLSFKNRAWPKLTFQIIVTCCLPNNSCSSPLLSHLCIFSRSVFVAAQRCLLFLYERHNAKNCRQYHQISREVRLQERHAVLGGIWRSVKHIFTSRTTTAVLKWGACTVATSPVVLRWLCDSPRTGCAWRIKPLYL